VPHRRRHVDPSEVRRREAWVGSLEVGFGSRLEAPSVRNERADQPTDCVMRFAKRHTPLDEGLGEVERSDPW
jgi:hypothetical protein